MLLPALGLGKHSGPLFAAAREYLARDWTPLPLRGKAPALPAWKHLRNSENRPDEDMLRTWFSGESGEHVTGVGIITGKGLAVRDFDTQAAYYRWADDHPALARSLPTVRTFRGYHVYHQTDQPTYRKLRPQGAGEYIATAGHYITAPPSRHQAGFFRYYWPVPLPPIGTPLPAVDPVEAGLLPPQSARGRERLAPEGAPPRPHTPSLSVVPTPLTIRAAALLAVPTGPGQRNEAILALVRSLDRHQIGLEFLDEAFDIWWEETVGVVRNKDREQNRKQFRSAWEASQQRRASGLADGCLDNIHDLAALVAVPQEFQQPATLRRLFQFHAHLQQLAGDQPHFLSCHLASRLLGVSPKTAWKWQQHLRAAGVLWRTKVGECCPGGDATEWLFLGQAAAGEAVAAG